MTNTLTYKWFIGALLATLIIGGFALYAKAVATPGVTARYNTANNIGYEQTYTFFTATTTTATSTNASHVNDSGYFNIAGAKKAVLYFKRDAGSGQNQGSTTFKMQVTPDGTNWYDYSGLVQATSTNLYTVNMQPTVNISGTTTVIYSLNLQTNGFFGVRCIAVVVTDGSNTCTAYAEY